MAGFARAGADVVITSRDASRLAETQRDIEAMGRRVFCLQLDVLNRESIQQFADAIGRRSGAGRDPGQQRRLQRAQARRRCDVGRLGPGASTRTCAGRSLSPRRPPGS